MEDWKSLINYPQYEVSNLGNVRRKLKNGTYRTLSKTKSRYSTIDLPNERVYVHRLVAMYFVPNPFKTDVVNHIDGNTHNNNADNLEWITNKENLEHATKILKRYPFGVAPKKVRKLTLNGEYLQTFDSIGEAVTSTGVPHARSHISECCSGKIVSAYGYKWEYVD